MSPGLALAETGYATHLANYGEAVTFRGVSETAIVNRGGRTKSFDSPNDTEDPVGATIQLRATLKPKVNEVITDAHGYMHRIEEDPVFLGYCWQCKCSSDYRAKR